MKKNKISKITLKLHKKWNNIRMEQNKKNFIIAKRLIIINCSLSN